MAGQRRLSALQAGLDSVVVETMMREVQVLTPEQRERYQRLMPWGVPGGGEGGPPGHPRGEHAPHHGRRAP